MFDVDYFERRSKKEIKRIAKRMRMINEMEKAFYDYDKETLTKGGVQVHLLMIEMGRPDWMSTFLEISQQVCDKAVEPILKQRLDAKKRRSSEDDGWCDVDSKVD